METTEEYEEEFHDQWESNSPCQQLCEALDQLERQTFLSIYRKSRILSVTDLVSVHWCDVQVSYALEMSSGQSVSRLETTKAMIQGTERHEILEKEFHDKVIIKDITTSEDICAVRWFHLLIGLNELQIHGRSREFPVMSVLNRENSRFSSMTESILISGVIDEICLPKTCFSDDISSSIRIHEVKTRSSKRLPSKSQQEQAQLQILLYGKLLSDMLNHTNEIYRHAQETLLLDMKLPLSDELQIHLQVNDPGGFLASHAYPLVTLDILWQWIEKEFAKTFVHLKLDQIQPTSMIYEVDYEYEGISLERVQYTYCSSFVHRKLEQSLKFWTSPLAFASFKGVTIEEAWKCGCCEFADICIWRDQQAQKR